MSSDPGSRTRENLYDVFISYSSDDSNAARRIAEGLRNEGLRPWLDQWEVKAGENFYAKMHEALSSSGSCVVLLSQAIQASSPSISSEWSAIQAQAWQRPEFKVVPVSIDPAAAVPTFLQTWQRVQTEAPGEVGSIAEKVKHILASDSDQVRAHYEALASTQLRRRFEELKSAAEQLREATDE